MTVFFVGALTVGIFGGNCERVPWQVSENTVFSK